MRKLLPLLLALVFAIPAVAQPPISGLGGGGNGRESALRRHWLGSGDQLAPDRDPRQGAELLGQLRQVDRRADHWRDNGQISGGEARRIHGETERIGRLYVLYSGDGLSESEAAELQSRIYVLRTIPVPAHHSAPGRGH